MMTRDGFLRAALLAPLAALVGCKRKPQELRVETSGLGPLTHGPIMTRKPIEATAWTVGTGSTSTTFWVNDATSGWTIVP